MGFGYTIMTNNIFSIAIFGFSHIERTLMAGVCKLSQARIRRYTSRMQAGFQVIEPSKAENVDIFLIDGDNAEALQSGQKAHAQSAAAPVITISKTPQESTNPGELTLARHRAGGLDLIIRHKLSKIERCQVLVERWRVRRWEALFADALDHP
jgi:hypothetical protein